MHRRASYGRQLRHLQAGQVKRRGAGVAAQQLAGQLARVALVAVAVHLGSVGAPGRPARPSARRRSVITLLRTERAPRAARAAGTRWRPAGRPRRASPAGHTARGTSWGREDTRGRCPDPALPPPAARRQTSNRSLPSRSLVSRDPAACARVLSSTVVAGVAEVRGAHEPLAVAGDLGVGVQGRALGVERHRAAGVGALQNAGPSGHRPRQRTLCGGQRQWAVPGHPAAPQQRVGRVRRHAVAEVAHAQAGAAAIARKLGAGVRNDAQAVVVEGAPAGARAPDVTASHEAVAADAQRAGVDAGRLGRLVGRRKVPPPPLADGRLGRPRLRRALERKALGLVVRRRRRWQARRQRPPPLARYRHCAVVPGAHTRPVAHKVGDPCLHGLVRDRPQIAQAHPGARRWVAKEAGGPRRRPRRYARDVSGQGRLRGPKGRCCSVSRHVLDVEPDAALLASGGAHKLARVGLVGQPPGPPGLIANRPAPHEHVQGHRL